MFYLEDLTETYCKGTISAFGGLKWILKGIAGRDWICYFEELCSPSPRILILSVHRLHRDAHTMRAAAGAYSEEKKQCSRGDLTGALGHGRSDAGAKMTDKRRVAKSSRVCG